MPALYRSFRQWRKNSRRSDEQMFIPANSIATTVAVDNEDHVQQLKTKPLHLIDEYSVSNVDNGQYTVDNEVSNVDNGQYTVNNTDNEVSNVDNEQQTKSGASLTDASDDNKVNSSNSDIVSALKEVCSILAPDFTDIQLPNEGKVIDVKVLGERTREHLNALYRSSILNSARNKAINIGITNVVITNIIVL